MYVLRKQQTLEIICKDSTIEKLENKIRQCYYNRRGLKSKGDNYTFNDYMEDKVVSELIIKDFDTSQLHITAIMQNA